MTFPTEVKVVATGDDGSKVTILVEGLTGVPNTVDLERHQVLCHRLFQHWHGKRPASSIGMVLPTTGAPV